MNMLERILVSAHKIYTATCSKRPMKSCLISEVGRNPYYFARVSHMSQCLINRTVVSEVILMILEGAARVTLTLLGGVISVFLAFQGQTSIFSVISPLYTLTQAGTILETLLIFPNDFTKSALICARNIRNNARICYE